MVERKDNLYNNADACYKVYSGEELSVWAIKCIKGLLIFPHTKINSIK